MKKEIIARSAVSAPIAGFPVATRAGHLLFISGRVGLDHTTGMPLSGYRELGRKPPPSLGLLAPDSWEEVFVSQASRIYGELETLLSEHGAKKTDLLFYSIYLREMRNFPVLVRTRAAVFESGVAPPSTASQVPRLLYPGAVVYFDPVALIPDPANGLTKEVLTSNHVVQGPLSNYELASRVRDYTFYAGVVGAHPETGLIIYGANELKDADWLRPRGGLAEQMMLEPISAQTYTIYKLLRAMLAEHGTGLESLLRLNIYLRSMRELPEVERIGNHFLPARVPAGTVIGVESLARRDFYIEIEGITYAGSSLRPAPRDARVASWARYVDAVRGGDLVFVSGLLGYDASDRSMVSNLSALGSRSARNVESAISGLRLESHEQLAAAAQTQSILDQLQIVLASLDSNLRSLLKITVYLRDMSDFPFVHKVLLSSLGDDPPAITALAVSDLPLREARLQIEAVAL
jgi:enamine deaminase RidA (YjgF/YER057c/UK114 family)